MSNELLHLPIEDVRANPVALRQVDKKSANYLEIVNTIPKVGILNAITVRHKVEVVTDDEGTPQVGDDGEAITEEFYELVDGLHRFTAAQDAGLEEIPAQILTIDDDTTLLTTQVIANLMRVETKPVEYKNQLLRILSKNPTWTEAELADSLGVSPDFIRKRLSLQKIENEEILKQIDAGNICLSNAFNLAKLPPEEQIEMMDAAMTEPAASFSGDVKKRVKELNDAKRQGREASEEFPGATPKGRKVKDLEAELENPESVLTDVQGLSDPTEIVLAVLRWALHLDSASVEKAKAAHEARVAERKEKARRRAESAAQKKQEKAAKKAEEAKAAAEAAAAEAAKLADAGA
jgi:ParB/RepB/Spo0J family partition protein